MQSIPLPTNSLPHLNNNRLAKRTTSNVALTPIVPGLTTAQMHSNFEEWIKMCTDNKVNASNTWNFALIDYFHEMTFIREGDSINFQKASCTLDGCVKIYTSRVDSVATETGKLLSGLADNTNVEGDDDDTRQGERRARKKTNRSEATLLKDFSTIALKKFDLDFTVDPLFKKTSADFDEGGARGLLLNHLDVDKSSKLVFDASDATSEKLSHEISLLEKNLDNSTEENNSTENVEEEQDVFMEEAENDVENVDYMDIDEPISSPITEMLSSETDSPSESTVELSRLKSRTPITPNYDIRNLVASLNTFSFFTEDDLEIPDLDHDDDEEGQDISLEDPFQYNDYDGADYDGADYDADDIDPFGFDDNNIPEDDLNGPELDNTDKSYPTQDYLTALVNNDEREVFTYFDSTLTNSWAGPEHWRLKRITARTTSDQDNTEKPKRKPKPTFQIPFNEQNNEDENEDTLFETSARKITQSKDALSKLTRPLLPDDIHFSSKQLLQYFIKPMFPTTHKKKSTTSLPTNTLENGIEDPDVNFWAEQAQDFPDDMDYGDDIPIDFNSIADQSTSMINDTFYQDTLLDDPEESVLYGDILITNHNLKKSKPLYVNYAKTAKRVDVKRLKDNLWKALTFESEEEEKAVTGVQKFTDVINNLKKMYSTKTMKDISVPFCFICLLHLANEKDLSINGFAKDDDDFVIGEGDWLNNENLLHDVTITQNNP